MIQIFKVQIPKQDDYEPIYSTTKLSNQTIPVIHKNSSLQIIQLLQVILFISILVGIPTDSLLDSASASHLI